MGGICAKHCKKLERQPTTPLLDRTIQGPVPVGSTFKVVDSVAALENGVITPSTIYDCTGSYTPPHTTGGSVWHCWATRAATARST